MATMMVRSFKVHSLNGSNVYRTGNYCEERFWHQYREVGGFEEAL